MPSALVPVRQRCKWPGRNTSLGCRFFLSRAGRVCRYLHVPLVCKRGRVVKSCMNISRIRLSAPTSDSADRRAVSRLVLSSVCSEMGRFFLPFPVSALDMTQRNFGSYCRSSENCNDPSRAPYIGHFLEANGYVPPQAKLPDFYGLAHSCSSSVRIKVFHLEVLARHTRPSPVREAGRVTRWPHDRLFLSLILRGPIEPSVAIPATETFFRTHLINRRVATLTQNRQPIERPSYIYEIASTYLYGYKLSGAVHL